MKTIRSVRFVKGLLAIFSLALISAGFAQTYDSNAVPVVTIEATQPYGTWSGTPAVFTLFRSGNPASGLNVYCCIGGSATNGVDYQAVDAYVSLAAGATSNTVVVQPINRGQTAAETVTMSLCPSPALNPVNYGIGSPDSATVYISATNFLSLRMTTPANGAVFDTPTNILLGAGFSYLNYRPLTNVEFFAGTNDLGPGSLGVSSGSSGTEYLTWTNPPAGDFALWAVGKATGGLTTTSAPVNIVVLAGPLPTNPPPVAISTPTNGEAFLAQANILILAPAGDPADPVKTVQFFANGQSLGVFTNPPPPPPGAIISIVPQILWTNVAGGNYALTAVATDYGGLSATSAPVNITVVSLGPPTLLSLESPNAGAVFYTPTNILITAWGSGAAALATNIEFFAGTNDLGAGSPGASAGLFGTGYYFTWTNPPPGDYVLTAVAKVIAVVGSDGNSVTSAPVNFSVRPGVQPTNLPPVVGIIAPTNDEIFTAPASVSLAAQASDPNASVTNVEFFTGSTDLGRGLGVVADPPGVNGVTGLIYILNWTNVPDNHYSLTAVARANNGLATTSAPVNITVLAAPTPTNVPPVVRITSPPNGAVFRAPLDVPLYAYAAAPGGMVTSVQFFASSNSLGFAQPVTGVLPPLPTPGQPQPLFVIYTPTNYWELVWTNPPVGTNVVLTALATDNHGVATVSAAISISLLPPLTPPTNRLAVVRIVATDPVAIEGTNCWTWLGLASPTATWSNWFAPNAICRLFTNCGPQNATFTVCRSGATNDSLTVAYGLGGSASNGVDYVSLPGVVTIPSGEGSAAISVVPLDDGPPDLTSSVVLKLVAGTNYVVGAPAAAAAIILDGQTPRPVTGLVPGTAFHLAATGLDGAWFHVETSPDLIHWTPVCTNQVVNGAIDYVDPAAPTNPALYYRTVPESAPPPQ
jgi:hypothetical protein